MEDIELHNRHSQLDCDLTDSHPQHFICPPITKDVLDNQETEAEPELYSNISNSAVPKFNPLDHINVQSVRVYFNGPQKRSRQRTQVSEKPYIMQWRGEHFRCHVKVTFSASMPRSNWTIGLAQACDSIALRNYFGNGGYYSWEFQPLKSHLHKMVNDSNGSQWPFYSHRAAMVDLAAHRPVSGEHKFSFSDYFYPTMHWYVKSGGYNYPLTNVSRRQGFKVWLLAIKRGANHPQDGQHSRYAQFRPKHDQVYVLKSMQWRYNIDLAFDTNRSLGQRCVAVNDVQEEQPTIFETIDPIPTSALVPPNCNSCQSLIFYPSDKTRALVLKKEPEEIVVPWKEWRDSMTKGYSKLVGFENPHPPPIMYQCYRSDPLIYSQPRERQRSSLLRRSFWIRKPMGV